MFAMQVNLRRARLSHRVGNGSDVRVCQIRASAGDGRRTKSRLWLLHFLSVAVTRNS
jgi:hypothetical protein